MSTIRAILLGACLAACQGGAKPAPPGHDRGFAFDAPAYEATFDGEPRAPGRGPGGAVAEPAPQLQSNDGSAGVPVSTSVAGGQESEPWIARPPARETREVDERTLEALSAAIRDEDFERARSILDAVISQPYLDDARGQLAAGAELQAIDTLEEGLRATAGQPELLRMLGEARLAVGQRTGDAQHFEAALRAFEEIGETPIGLLGASRAARALQRAARALELARAGWTSWQALPPDQREAFAGMDTELPERTLAEALFAAYARADDDSAPGLFAETEEALSLLMTAAPDDPWVWIRLSELYRLEGRPFDAREMAARGLDRDPRSHELVVELVRSAREVDGRDGVLAALDALQQRHPRSPLGYWYSAQERFREVLARPKSNPRDALDDIEYRLRRCREADATYARECMRWEALCRSAAGWYGLRSGNLWAAQKAFESMEVVVPGGLNVEFPGELESGIVGLTRVARGFQEQGANPAAAEVWNTLREHQPQRLQFAVQAGYSSRRAGEDLEKRAASLDKAARGEIKNAERLNGLRELASIDPADAGSEDERRRFEITARSSRKRARRLFEDSYAAYLAASALAPEDIRIVNDTAEIPIYHLGRDLDRAEAKLLRCIELGEKQIQAPGLSEDDRTELENAWGDAYQNLGYLCLEYKKDNDAARRWLERSVAVGTDPRPLVMEVLLPRARDAAAPDPSERRD